MNLNFIHWRSLKTRLTIVTLVFFLISIWSLSFYVSRMLREDMQRLLSDQQFSTVSVLAADLNRALDDRMGALQGVASSIRQLDDADALQARLERSHIVQQLFNGGAFVATPDGMAMASVPLSAGRVGLNYLDRDYIVTTLREGKTTIGKPVLGKALKAPLFGIATAIFDTQGRVIGVLVGVVDLSKPNFLDQVTENRYGKTGDYFIAALQHRLNITSSDKKRIMESLPAPGVNPYIDRFIAGYEGSVRYVNQHGVDMLVSVKGIPLANWAIVATLPAEEAFAPVLEMQRHMLLATLFFTFLLGGLAWWAVRWILKRQLSPMLAASQTLSALSDLNQVPKPLPITSQDEIGELIAGFNRLLETLRQREVALIESEFRWKFAVEGSGDGVWDWNIQTGEALYSRRWKEMLGFDESEISNKASEWSSRVHPEDMPGVMEIIQAHMDGKTPSAAVEFRMLCKDGIWRWMLGRGMVVNRDSDGKALRLIGTNADITERILVEVALRQKERYQRALLDNFPFAVWLKDTESRFLAVNNGFAQLFGASSTDALIGKNDFDIAPHDMAEGYRADDRAVLASRQKKSVEEEILSEGVCHWFETYKAPVIDESGVLLGTVGFARDITERKQSEEKLKLAASVFSHAREGIMITAMNGTIIDVNDAFTRITGYRRDEVLGRLPSLFSSGRHEKSFYAAMWRSLIENGHWSGEVWNRRKNGEVYAEMKTISAVRDAQGNAQQYVSLFSDITLLKEHEQQLEHIAHYDALTTLPNRVLLADRLQQSMAQAERRGQSLAVAYLDLDGFKAVNDHHGHAAGDQLLIALAARMKQALREGDTLARLGGDEFVAILLDLEDVAASVPMLERLLAAAALPVHVNDLILQVSASVGVTFYPQEDAVDGDQLLRQSDQAMYQAKLAGRNRYHFFDAAHDRSVRGHHESLEHIRRALAEREFVLHYQPKVNMRTGAVIGAEALIRWQHPERGLLPPAVFLPVIESHPLAIDLGEWVIDSALSQMALWQAMGLDIPVSVNVGARQLQQPGFTERLRVLLAAHPEVKPEDLELEVLETSALEDLAQASEVIEACRQIGVMFALDDFGTGYSSLTYLKRLHVSLLKIDQSFVRDMLDDPDDLAILEGVLGLARAFQRAVIAEGVETVEHGVLLLQLGCEQAQGFCIAHPMPAADLPRWVAGWRTDPAWAGRPAVSRDDLSLLYAGVEHRAWIGAMGSHLKGARQAPPPLDHHQCRFGQWLDVEGQARYGAQSAFQAIERLHQQVHALATALSKLQADGRNAEALAKLDQLHALRDDLLEQLKKVVPENR